MSTDPIETILQQRGRERRALGERYMSGSCCSEEPGANPGCCPDTLAQRSAAVYVSTASRAEPDDALRANPRIGERDLADALEEALMVDGPHRRAMAVLFMWKAQSRG